MLAAIFIIGINVELFVSNELLYKPHRQRLVMSGISSKEIYLTVIAGLICVDLFLILMLKGFGRIIGIGD